jgi:hypothetical protein
LRGKNGFGGRPRRHEREIGRAMFAEYLLAHLDRAHYHKLKISEDA